MNEDPSVSVIMPTLNEVETVGEAIRSVLDQTYEDFEFLVIDGGSTDGTVDRIREFADERIRLVREEEPKGISRALNRGIEESTGEYVARMDADDRSHPERFRREVAVLDSSPDISLVATWCRVIGRDGETITVNRVDDDRSFDVDDIVEHKAGFAHGSVMLHRETLETVGGYRGKFDMAEDLDLWLRISERFGGDAFHVLPDVLYEYRISDGQMDTVNAQHAVAEYAKEAALRRRIGREEPSASELEIVRSRHKNALSDSRKEAMYHYHVGLWYLYSDDVSSAQRRSVRAARECPTALRPWYLLGLTVLPRAYRRPVRKRVHTTLEQIRGRLPGA